MHIRVSDFLYPDSSNSVSKLRQKYPAAVLVRFTEVKTNVTATIRLMDGTEYQDLWLDEKFGWSKKEIIP